MKDNELNADPQEVKKCRSGRCYSHYNSDGSLDFDPIKDLNLPADQAEVVARFKRLQGARAMEVLN